MSNRGKYSKANLPEKLCVVCHRPFAWRRKWADCWEEVKYCSERCRRNRKSVERDRIDKTQDRGNDKS